MVNKKFEDEAVSSILLPDISKEEDATINPAVVNQSFFVTTALTKREESDANSKEQNPDNLNKNLATKN